jgi:peptidoglycan/xylan/chitin deacetylase (PgdA/CDA1 family)
MPLAPFLPLVYRFLQPTFPDCLWAGRDDAPTIALTFDDGPHPQYTAPLLEVLDRYQIPVSFFWLGVCVQRAPAIARAVWQRRQHGIGLHGYYHQAFPRLTPNELRQSLEQTQAAIAQACHLNFAEVQEIRNVRPPNGLFTPRTLAYLRQWQYRPVMWSVVPEDWVQPGVAVVVQRILNQTRNGSLIVLHDGDCGGQDVTAITAQLIPRLLEQGYRFVTVDQFWQQRQGGRGKGQTYN